MEISDTGKLKSLPNQQRSADNLELKIESSRIFTVLNESDGDDLNLNSEDKVKSLTKRKLNETPELLEDDDLFENDSNGEKEDKSLHTNLRNTGQKSSLSEESSSINVDELILGFESNEDKNQSIVDQGEEKSSQHSSAITVDEESEKEELLVKEELSEKSKEKYPSDSLTFEIKSSSDVKSSSINVDSSEEKVFKLENVESEESTMDLQNDKIAVHEKTSLVAIAGNISDDSEDVSKTKPEDTQEIPKISPEIDKKSSSTSFEINDDIF